MFKCFALDLSRERAQVQRSAELKLHVIVDDEGCLVLSMNIIPGSRAELGIGDTGKEAQS